MGVSAVPVKTARELSTVDGLIIPGGESTTIGMLMERFGLLEATVNTLNDGGAAERQGVAEAELPGPLPVFGTCAGAILLAAEIVGSGQPRLGVIPMTIERNAYGRQIESFEVSISELSYQLTADASAAGEHPAQQQQQEKEEQPLPLASRAVAKLEGVFIRAPIIRAVGAGVDVLARYEGNPVVVQSGPYLAATFHPELAGETRVHRHFVNMVSQSLSA